MTKNSVCHTSYLRNHTPYGTHVENDNISRCFFNFSKFFSKRAKLVQNDKKFCLCTPCLKNHISYDCHLCLHVFFFIFSKFWFLGLLGEGVKGQKMVQNDKKFCPLCLIFQEPCIIWSSFMVHMWKRIISPFFQIFQNFIFGVH